MEWTRQRLASEVVEEVEYLLSIGLSYSNIVKKTGVSKASISKIKNGTYKKAPISTKFISEEEYEILKQENYKLKEEILTLRKQLENRSLTLEECTKNHINDERKVHSSLKVKEESLNNFDEEAIETLAEDLTNDNKKTFQLFK